MCKKYQFLWYHKSCRFFHGQRYSNLCISWTVNEWKVFIKMWCMVKWSSSLFYLFWVPSLCRFCSSQYTSKNKRLDREQDDSSSWGYWPNNRQNYSIDIDLLRSIKSLMEIIMAFKTFCWENWGCKILCSIFTSIVFNCKHNDKNVLGSKEEFQHK